MDAKRQGEAGSSRYTIHALVKALDLLEVLAQKGSLTLTELCRELGQPKSSVFRHLATLEMCGYVRHSPDSETYRLGTKLIELGNAVKAQFDVHEEAVPFMRQLQEAFSETVNLAILEEGKVVYLDILEGTQPIRMAARPGRRDFVHSTAIGKVILAHSAETVVDAIIDQHGLPALTPQTITTADELKAALSLVCTQGYAVDNLENEDGVCCVGAPIFNHHGEAIAAISISGPASRFSAARIEALGNELKRAAQSISERLGYRSENATDVRRERPNPRGRSR